MPYAYALPSAIPREEIAYVYPMRYATPCTLNGSSLRWDDMAECVPEASSECHISFIFDLRSSPESPDSARLRLPQYLCSRRNLLLQSFRRMDGTLEGDGIEEGKGEKKEHSDIQISPCGSQFAGGTFFTCWQIYASQ